MSDESQVQIARVDGSSLTLAKPSSGLIARGRQDAAVLPPPAPAAEIDPLAETRRLAEAGDGWAQIDIGNAYYKGQDYAEGIRWFRKAADQDYPDAHFKLGGMYERGEGVARDDAEAFRCYRIASDLAVGDDTMQTHITVIHRKAAEPGYARAQYNLGRCITSGFGVPGAFAGAQDAFDAVKWFRKAAEQGLADAQYELGNAYVLGQGVTQDYAEGAKWYRAAAEGGHADARWNLGAAYYLGNGVGQDYAEAAKWFRIAAEQGHADAQCDLGACYRDGRGVVQDYQEAIAWFTKAAAQGQVHAQFYLGEAHYNIEGVPRDYVKAHMWANLAAAASTGEDQKKYSSALEEVARKMTPRQIAEAQRLAREWKPTNTGGQGLA